MRRYVEHLIDDSRVVEIRHLPDAQSGTFDSADRLVGALGRYRRWGNLYCSLNEPRVDAINGFGCAALCDSDVVRIRRLPFDFDPVRPDGSASTLAQIGLARHLALRVANNLCGIGFPKPLVALSGNGYHLQYRVNLPANKETAEMLRAIYRGLDGLYSSPSVSFDRTVRNPSRILRLYGTVNRKGGCAQRTAYWIEEPWKLLGVTEIERLANLFERAQREPSPRPRNDGSIITGSGDYKTLDVARWFAAHGLYEGQIGGPKHAVTCPWEHEHSSSSPNDTIILEAAGGWPNFYCHHDHCADRRIPEVMAALGDADAYCSRRYESEKQRGEQIR